MTKVHVTHHFDKDNSISMDLDSPLEWDDLIERLEKRGWEIVGIDKATMELILRKGRSR